MFFNSLSFAIFLPTVFILYWFATKGNVRLQNILLLVSSYFFYACWDWRFMFLLVFSTLLDFYTGIKICEAKQQRSKLIWLQISIVINLGFLGVFKYYNFFADSFADGLSLLGFNTSLGSLQVILPVGISFYTFHGLSYVLDLYKDRMKPERNFIDYAVFVSFFPLLVAGPIERATHLLPQILKKRQFDYAKAVDGLRQILWGLFKKIVIADNCAEYANKIFNNSADYSGSTHVLGALFFTFQIYCDFSGYSDIAIGTARLFGIDLLRNFAFPYFSRDVAEFWRRWHISLSSWFKDYLYIPLGGSKGGTWIKVRNTFIIFLVSGFWHGANWTFLIWGFLNALYIMPSILSNTNRNNLDIVAKGKYLPTIKDVFSIGLTFSLTVFAWIFFRAANLSDAYHYIGKIFSLSVFTVPYFPGIGLTPPIIALTGVFVLIEWIGREKQFAIASLGNTWYKPLRWSMYYSIIATIIWFVGKEQQFIYFQF
jgi:D-alanyl-lipoteichoic acid acyltransferase DltB (MBOAT superfamily)